MPSFHQLVLRSLPSERAQMQFCQGGTFIKRKGVLTKRVRKVRSDLGKKHAYTRKKTNTSELATAPNARLIQRDGKAKIFLAAPPSEAVRTSILEDLSPPKRRREA